MKTLTKKQRELLTQTKLIEEKLVPETTWMLYDFKTKCIYFEDFIWNNRDFLQELVDSKDFSKNPKWLQNKVKGLLDTISDTMDTMDFFSDDAEAFLMQNFWVFVGDFISEGKVKEYVSLVREKCAFFLDENDEDCLSFIKTLENLEEFEGSK